MRLFARFLDYCKDVIRYAYIPDISIFEAPARDHRRNPHAKNPEWSDEVFEILKRNIEKIK